jgi:recombination protein RecA
MYGEGISKTGELIDLGVKADVVEKSGSWYSYGDERIGQGRENVRTFLKDNPDIAADLERKIRINEGLIEDELLMPKEEQVEDDGEPDNVTSLGA